MNLETPVTSLFMVGPAYVQRLKKLEIKTVGDLLYHFPHRYEDFSNLVSISDLKIGEKATITGEVVTIQNQFTRSSKKIQRAVIRDKTGIIEATWFNQPFLIKTLRPGTKINLSGQPTQFRGKKIFNSPEHEIVQRSTGSEAHRLKAIHTGRLVPVYPETAGLSSKWLRSRIAPLIKKSTQEIEEFLPSSVMKRNDLIGIKEALEQIHFPKSIKRVETARKRFAFEEFFLIQINIQERKTAWKKEKTAPNLSCPKEKISQFKKSLPFKLTSAQEKVSREILIDIAKNKPMNRLLEGDVGSGKTVVAAMAILASFLNNSQSALMAPTTILAHQHFKTLDRLLGPFGVKTTLLTGAEKKPTEKFNLLVGTQALIHKRAQFENLGLIIIDEQHRFGVNQRGTLVKKQQSKNFPHLLTMTATPIPRTIALTLYGDLDLSILDELPPGRIKNKTWIIPNQKRTSAHQWIKEEIKKGSQAFIVCPLIEESQSETLSSVKAAKIEFQILQKTFSKFNVGLLHGKMKPREKEIVLTKFKGGDFSLLVTTPVVEVGIDIPNATIIVIEGAERFGLAQLHQLRGRVGRNKEQSYCLLFSNNPSQNSLKRLRAMEKNHQGISLAEIDLKLRGPGEIYGRKQHGFLKLKAASLDDLSLIRKTKQEAKRIFLKLNKYPLLKEELKKYKISHVEPN